MDNERVNIDVKNIEKEVANVTEATMKHAFIMKGIEKYIYRSLGGGNGQNVSFA